MLRKRSWLFYSLGLLIAGVTFAAFHSSLHNDFVTWDDVWLISENQDFRGLGLTQIKWMFGAPAHGNYSPMSWLTLALDYCLWGMNPEGYHLTNLLIHIACVFRSMTATVTEQTPPPCRSKPRQRLGPMSATFLG